MKLVKAQCVNCNGELEVDPGLRAAYCLYCGTKFLIDQAINNYRINHVERIDAEVVNVYNAGGQSRGYTGNLNEDIKKAEQLLAMGEYGEADEILEDLKANYPSDYRVWFACIKNCFVRDELHFDSQVSRYIENISKIDKNGRIGSETKHEINSYLKAKAAGLRQNMEAKEKQLQDLTDQIDDGSRVRSSQGEFSLDELTKKITYYKEDKNCSKVHITAVAATLVLGLVMIAQPDGATGFFQFTNFLGACIIGGMIFGAISFVICAFLKSDNRRRLRELEQLEQSASNDMNEMQNRYRGINNDYVLLKNSYEFFCLAYDRLEWG